MPIAITCPECAEPFKVPDADAEKMARCPRCQCPVEPRHPKVAADAIQVTASPARSTRKVEEDDEDFARPTRHGTPRSPFPWSALYIVVIGILFFLLAFSAGFNAWFLSKAENPFQANNEAMRRQQAEAAMQAAQQAEAMAREQAARADKNAAAARRELEDAQRELQRAREEINDLKRKQR